MLRPQELERRGRAALHVARMQLHRVAHTRAALRGATFDVQLRAELGARADEVECVCVLREHAVHVVCVRHCMQL